MNIEETISKAYQNLDDLFEETTDEVTPDFEVESDVTPLQVELKDLEEISASFVEDTETVEPPSEASVVEDIETVETPQEASQIEDVEAVEAPQETSQIEDVEAVEPPQEASQIEDVEAVEAPSEVSQIEDVETVEPPQAGPQITLESLKQDLPEDIVLASFEDPFTKTLDVENTLISAGIDIIYG